MKQDIRAINMKRAVMRRVYLAYWLRTTKHFFPASILAPLALTVFAGYVVSIPHVVNNFLSASHNFSSIYTFFVSAFTNTTFIVQVLCVGIVLSGMFFVHDVLRRFMIKSTHDIFSKRPA